MEIFTKERYEEMQIASFLIFPETEKDWEENVNWHISEGFFFEEKLHVLFKAIKLTMTIVLLLSG
ncbi:DUF4085 family protein [Paenibacillus sp. DMB20]|uniref:DUF4085 family protein n=1 Tax=Paenibacillus sp. DMB20 TaxID=1642570 RepID=UPI00128B3BCE|nr:DUF4085 family protein [Paenibacillus sp. DMB20]